MGANREKTGSVTSPVTASMASEQQRSERAERALRKWHAETAQAAVAFEGRWRWLTLRRIDPDLGERLWDQRSRFQQACVMGTAEQIEASGEALCRGYALAAALLQAANTEDDAYSIGECYKTGTKVCISTTKAVIGRVRELLGEGVVYITPDEIATLLASDRRYKATAEAMQLFPGSEVMGVNET